MSRIIIATYHTAINYGAQLQLYGLYTAFKNQGAEVYLLHEAGTVISRDYSLTSRNLPRSPLKFGVWLFTNLPYFLFRRRQFASFLTRYNFLSLDELEPQDKIVFGSDQIWNLTDLLFLGHGVNRASKWSYAASMHSRNVVHQNSDLFRNSLKTFHGISVRESSVKQAIEEIGFPNIHHHIDPAFLLDVDEDLIDNFQAKTKETLAVYYGLQRKDDFLSSFRTRETGKKRLEINSRHFDVLLNYRKEPSNLPSFVRAFAEAAIVYTTSFHGFALSLLLRKNVVITAVSSGNSRFTSLIKMLDLKVEKLDDSLLFIDMQRQDMNKLDLHLNQLKEEANDYLRTIIQHR